jgi:hypothetical protein
MSEMCPKGEPQVRGGVPKLTGCFHFVDSWRPMAHTSGSHVCVDVYFTLKCQKCTNPGFDQNRKRALSQECPKKSKNVGHSSLFIYINKCGSLRVQCGDCSRDGLRVPWGLLSGWLASTVGTALGMACEYRGDCFTSFPWGLLHIVPVELDGHLSPCP